jgi:hypothetical protein
MIIGVIQHLFISTAFGFAIATVVFLVKGQRAATRYRLWLMAELTFAVPTIVFTSLGDWLHRAWVPERLFADWVVNFPTARLMGHSDLLLPSGPIVSYATAWATLTGIWCLRACFHLSAWFIRLGRQHRPSMEALLSRSKWCLRYTVGWLCVDQCKFVLRCREGSCRLLGQPGRRRCSPTDVRFLVSSGIVVDREEAHC